MARSSPRQLYINGQRANRTMGNASTMLGNMSVAAASEAHPQDPTGIKHAGGGGDYIVAKPSLKGWGYTHPSM